MTRYSRTRVGIAVGICAGVSAALPVFAGDATRGLWSLQPIRRPSVPRLKTTGWVRNPLDAFILAGLERNGLRPSAEADRPTLIRRLALDLTGLPPLPEEVDAFAADGTPGAYERVVDRYLASPHFGERWGRHWLDIARYSDTDGFGPDRLRPFAWRWRDWVIDAINRDLPFDQFTTQQIAGDLLPRADLSERLATGFHRNTLSNREAGTDPEESRTKAVKDRVNTVGAAWLGFTVACAECHDHKYDPISQREYYSLYAFFNNADERDVPVTPTPADRLVHVSAKKSHEAYLKDLQSDLAAYRQRLENSLPEFEARLGASPEKLPAAVREALAVPILERTEAQTRRILDYYLATEPGVVQRTKNIDAARRNAPAVGQAVAMVLEEVADKRRESRVHQRGDFLKPLEVVTPATPASLPPLKSRGATPDRLDLARWLVDPAHPLTARVTVNRVWRQLFGRGLVETVDDFGTHGDPPSHPELLDWLAATFKSPMAPEPIPTREPGLSWSMKRLIRLMVCSAAYRQTSERTVAAARDPENRWFSRQNRIRLEAEALRDSALSAAGVLVRDIGGPSFRPPLPEGAREVAFRLDLSYIPDEGPVLNRRSLYQFTKRNLPNPLLAVFDAPDASVTCTRRARTNTPLQALTLLNDPVFSAAAAALADRVLRELPQGSAVERLTRMFRLCVGRKPEVSEVSTLERLRTDVERLAAGDRAARAGWIAAARAVLNLDETVTRE